MAIVTLMTFGSWYRGEMSLTSATGAEVRFLDALNFPQRMMQQGTRAIPSIVLNDARRMSRRGGDEIPCVPALALRPEAIVLGWEEAARRPLAAAPGEGGAGTWDYEQRRGADRQRVLLETGNAMRIEGAVTGGTHVFDAGGKEVAKMFFACTGVVLADLTLTDPPRIIPFLAVNVRNVEAWGLIPENPSSA